jgi:hypothetical protein
MRFEKRDLQNYIGLGPVEFFFPYWTRHAKLWKEVTLAHAARCVKRSNNLSSFGVWPEQRFFSIENNQLPAHLLHGVILT